MATGLTEYRQINHKVLRVVVGAIAVLLSPVVYLLADIDGPLRSISFSYWTDSHDIFVGSLIAVGFFLSAYNGGGNGRDWEYRLSKAACLFAICIALFPTTGLEGDVPASWVMAIAETFGATTKMVHDLAAFLLFTCLIILMWFFSKRALEKGKAGRAKFYRAMSILMAVSIPAIPLIGWLFSITNWFFWLEAWELTLFGVGWLVAGSYKSENIPS